MPQIDNLRNLFRVFYDEVQLHQFGLPLHQNLVLQGPVLALVVTGRVGAHREGLASPDFVFGGLGRCRDEECLGLRFFSGKVGVHGCSLKVDQVLYLLLVQNYTWD